MHSFSPQKEPCTLGGTQAEEIGLLSRAQSFVGAPSVSWAMSKAGADCSQGPEEAGTGQTARGGRGQAARDPDAEERAGQKEPPSCGAKAWSTTIAGFHLQPQPRACRHPVCSRDTALPMWQAPHTGCPWHLHTTPGRQ